MTQFQDRRCDNLCSSHGNKYQEDLNIYRGYIYVKYWPHPSHKCLCLCVMASKGNHGMRTAELCNNSRTPHDKAPAFILQSSRNTFGITAETFQVDYLYANLFVYLLQFPSSLMLLRNEPRNKIVIIRLTIFFKIRVLINRL